MTVCACDRRLPDGTGSCLKCGRPIRLEAPTREALRPVEVKRRQKISEAMLKRALEQRER